ncbi:hypothetical protein AAGG74_18180 [Bacillus mexicanus]|uniref:hypothetical protein n=1 Tax=Bacillus mexicanus TaxID=2834415 RepID=UPI003D2483BD
MFKILLGLALGIFGLYYSKDVGLYAIICMLAATELLTVFKKVEVGNLPMIVGMFLCEAYFLYTGSGITELNYFLYVCLYLFVRFKGNKWFIDNNVNEYVYLIFTLSVPIFLDFVTKLMNFDMGVLPFITMYLIFLRMTDDILKSRIVVILFTLIQIVSAFTLEKFMIQDDLKMYFALGLIIWTILKIKVVVNKNVSRIFDERVFYKSGKGIY